MQMMTNSKTALSFIKAIAVGALTGVVFGVVLLALPGAALLLVVAIFGFHWDLSWIPEVSAIMALGGVLGGTVAGFLFNKDKHIPYVEEVQEFEDDPD